MQSELRLRPHLIIQFALLWLAQNLICARDLQRQISVWALCSVARQVSQGHGLSGTRRAAPP